MNEAYMATLGVYEIMSQEATYGWYVNLLYNGATDIAQVSPGTSPDWRTIPNYLGIPETNFYYQTWSAFYSGIDRANVVIERIPQMELFSNGTEDEKAQLRRMLGKLNFCGDFIILNWCAYGEMCPLKQEARRQGII
ncbi:hypothetical protein [Niabella hibiscisoli]|uniref:hypothetical protein n=1 Tax=Niabella hibiscisoli TaxID=1825928 RepID=UPI001F0E4E92|nr:hypothetical protein [Niabella hibiscisoli]MCH5719316.1 hypothetical protein [Niabella hibiscisoli]